MGAARPGSVAAADLADVAFVPAKATPPAKPTEQILVKYGQACVAADEHLVWTLLPVMPTDVLPPRSTWTALGIRSPPKLNRVL